MLNKYSYSCFLLHAFSCTISQIEIEFLDQSHYHCRNFDSVTDNYEPCLDRIWENMYLLDTDCVHGKLEFVIHSSDRSIFYWKKHENVYFFSLNWWVVLVPLKLPAQYIKNWKCCKVLGDVRIRFLFCKLINFHWFQLVIWGVCK